LAINQAELAQRRCEACTGQTPPVDEPTIESYLRALPQWTRSGHWIGRRFRFADYDQTIAFVNRVAALAKAEDHHPVMEVGYRQCVVWYTTHAIEALSANDFICAAKVEALVEQ
jgi:4a-hydroxytetrahydrobiopterin dehydratase